MTISDSVAVRCCWKRVTKKQGIQPSPRHGHRAVSIRHYILIFGGGNEGIIDDLHVYDTISAQWLNPPVHGDIPSGCAAFGLVVENFRLLMFGGMLEYGKYSGELYQLSAKTWEWKKLKPKPPKVGIPPVARIGHTFTLVGSNRIFLFGGLANESEDPRLNALKFLNDLYVLELRNNNAAWELPITHGASPGPRESHTAVAYQVMSPSGNSSGASLIVNPKTTGANSGAGNSTASGKQWRLLIYGGMNGHRLGDVWRLDIDTMTWHEINTGGIPPTPRSLHTANIIGNKMFVFGGWVPSSSLKKSHNLDSANSDGQVASDVGEWSVTDELASLNLDTLSWEEVRLSPDNATGGGPFDPATHLSNATVTAAAKPLPRAAHCSVVMPGGRLYIWSGRDGYRKMWNAQVGQKLWVCFTDMWFLETQRPPAPMNLRQLRATSDSIEVAWSNTPCTDYYCLQISLANGNNSNPPSPTESDKTSPIISLVNSVNKSLIRPQINTTESSEHVPLMARSMTSTPQPRFPGAVTPGIVGSGATGYRIVRPATVVSAATTGAVSSSGISVRALTIQPTPLRSGTLLTAVPSLAGGRIIRVLTPTSQPLTQTTQLVHGNPIATGSRVILQRPISTSTTPTTIRIVSSASSQAGKENKSSINNLNLPQLDGDVSSPLEEEKVKEEQTVNAESGTITTADNQEEIQVGESQESIGPKVIDNHVTEDTYQSAALTTSEDALPSTNEILEKIDESSNVEGAELTNSVADEDDEEDEEDDTMENDVDIHDAYWFHVAYPENTQWLVKRYFKSDLAPDVTKSSDSTMGVNSAHPLLPDHAYHFRVSACNSLGRGPWSAWATFRTLPQTFQGADSGNVHRQEGSSNVSQPEGEANSNEKPPSRAPTGIEIIKSEDGGAFLTWDRLPSDNSDQSYTYILYMASRKENTDPSQPPQKVFLRLYQGTENRAYVTPNILARAYIEQPQDKAAIIFRIVASNNAGTGPATQVRWLQASTSSSSVSDSPQPGPRIGEEF